LGIKWSDSDSKLLAGRSEIGYTSDAFIAVKRTAVTNTDSFFLADFSSRFVSLPRIKFVNYFWF